LLGRYAWSNVTSQNHAWPCGSLLPNELGLFDMLGNLWEWCQDLYQTRQADTSGKVFEDVNRNLYVEQSEPRLLRGGAYNHPPAGARSANRGWNAPEDRWSHDGFRPSRTYH
jgi:formylglycine-generating enzyme required for sulfatase activity